MQTRFTWVDSWGVSREVLSAKGDYVVYKEIRRIPKRTWGIWFGYRRKTEYLIADTRALYWLTAWSTLQAARNEMTRLAAIGQ